MCNQALADLDPAEVGVALEAYRQGTEAFGLWLWLPDYRDSLDYVEFLPEGVAEHLEFEPGDEEPESEAVDEDDRAG